MAKIPTLRARAKENHKLNHGTFECMVEWVIAVQVMAKDKGFQTSHGSASQGRTVQDR